ncbi:MAG: hypothetical protein KGJ02_04930 [Verrucomicrobiota bacterium]|nr:hypothetical protein [Verrucomicrobiota bacterium]
MKKELLLIGLCILAQSCGKAQPVKKENVAKVGNQKCPVSGQPVHSAHVYIHNGKEYGLCNNGDCASHFSQNPDKYAEIAEAIAKE